MANNRLIEISSQTTGTFSISGATDSTITSPVSGDILQWNGSEWVNIDGSNIGSGGGGGITWTSETSAFSIESGNGYLVDTTSAAITGSLPASASDGDYFEILDAAGTFGTNNFTLSPDGSDKIMGSNDTYVFRDDNAGASIIFYATNSDWRVK